MWKIWTFSFSGLQLSHRFIPRCLGSTSNVCGFKRDSIRNRTKGSLKIKKSSNAMRKTTIYFDNCCLRSSFFCLFFKVTTVYSYWFYLCVPAIVPVSFLQQRIWALSGNIVALPYLSDVEHLTVCLTRSVENILSLTSSKIKWWQLFYNVN